MMAPQLAAGRRETAAMSSTDSGSRKARDRSRTSASSTLSSGAARRRRADLSEGDVARVPAPPDGRGATVLTHRGGTRMANGTWSKSALRDEVWDQYPGGDDQRSREIEAGSGPAGRRALADLNASQHLRSSARGARCRTVHWDRLSPERGGSPSRSVPAWSPLEQCGPSRRSSAIVVGPDRLPRDYLDVAAE